MECSARAVPTGLASGVSGSGCSAADAWCSSKAVRAPALPHWTSTAAVRGSDEFRFVLADEVAQRCYEFLRVPEIMPPQGGTDVVDAHVPQLIRPMRLLQEVLGQCRGGHVIDVLVLGDCGNLGLVEARQGNAILSRDVHSAFPFTEAAPNAAAS
jgi:hypothetical protein